MIVSIEPDAVSVVVSVVGWRLIIVSVGPGTLSVVGCRLTIVSVGPGTVCVTEM
jgi:hypothetical protein